MPSASDELNASTRTRVGLCRSKPRFVSSLHMTPDDTIPSSVGRCQRRGSLSSASKIGFANASPTIAIVFTFSRSTASRSSVASNRRDSSVTTEPPTASMPIELNAPVPCMRGQAGRWTGPGPFTVLRTPSRPPSSGTRMMFPLFNLANRSSWRHMTPLGTPVVPPV